MLGLGALTAFGPAPARAAHGPVARVTIGVLPAGTTVGELSGVRGLTTGLLGAGLGGVSATQTYLDIGQGNRIWRSLYDRPLPGLRIAGGEVEAWPAVVARAKSAPADIVPGLLGSSLRAYSGRGAGLPSLISADRTGRVRPAGVRCSGPGCTGSLVVRRIRVGQMPTLVSGLRETDLLIAFAAPPPRPRRQLVVAIAGPGFSRGVLASNSTRMPGFVLATDIAPTVLARLGRRIPPQMSGRPIHGSDGRSAADLPSLEHRLAQIAPRRGPVIRDSVLAWLALVGLAGLAFRRRGLRTGVALLALAAVYMPAVLLIGAALEPSLWIERLIVGLGAPLAALGTLALSRGFAAIALASAVTVAAYAVDMVAGSPLTSLSLMGPNPALGARFYGIGNELEATLAVLTLTGAGAAMAAARWSPARSARGFVIAAIAATAVFATGRFGADVGAAIVFPAGGAAAALASLGGGRPRSVLVWLALAPLLALGGLALADLLLGGDSHLSRSVLQTGGLDSLADVADRRISLSARSFTRSSNLAFLVLAAALTVGAVRSRERIAAWFAGNRPGLAGLAGAGAATVVGALANDSGALLLVIGAGYLLAYLAYAWAQGPRTGADRPTI